MTTEELLFFSGAKECLMAYEALRERILAACPETRVIVSKTQIAFAAKRRFAFASLRGKRLIVSFGLGDRMVSPRVWQAVEPYPHRWTHHVRLSSAAEVDSELIAWIEQAYAFAERK